MIKTIKTMTKQEKERYNVPRKVQDVIPVRRIWPDGIFLVGTKFTKTYKFTDINYLVASREDKESMFLTYSELLNSLDSGAVTKITVNNRRMNKANFEQSILMPMQGDFRDEYRREYNQMLLDKATGANGIMQEKYITISVVKKDIEEARAYFSRVGADLVSHFAALGSKCVELDATERLRILHDFYRQGEEAEFRFNAREMMKRGHDFRDYICPDGIEKNSDYLKLGEKYCRVLFLKDYASYIKDNMVTELTDFNRNMMLSIDIVPVPTDEAVREVENRLLGVETNITNWQRRQNANNNFSAVVPYDMELQRKESKEFLDDLTTRDQRMMFAVITLAITADTKEQLDSDTEAVLSVARKHMCQLATLKFQQLDGLNRESTVDLDKRVVVFDIRGLGQQLKPTGLLVITDTILNRVTLNWKRGKRTHVFLDEFHVVFENEQSGVFFNSAWRQFRKRGAYPTAITQNVEYLLDSVQASTMLSNSEFIVMLNQAASDREKLAKLLNISKEQMSYVTNADAGCGLIRYGSALVPFINRFPRDTKLYELMTTKPGEGVFGGEKEAM